MSIKKTLANDPKYISRCEVMQILGISEIMFRNIFVRQPRKFDYEYGFFKRADIMPYIEDILERKKIDSPKWVGQ